MGVTTKISEPTLMVCMYGGGTEKVRESVDLNKATQQKYHDRNIPYPQSGSTDRISKLDANYGFWQIPLAEEYVPDIDDLHNLEDTFSTNFHSE